MFSIKSAVVTAIQSSTALNTLQGNKIYAFHPPNFTDLPIATYFELDNTGNLYADNSELGSEIIYQIDLWNKGDLITESIAVDDIMTALDFTRITARDLFEQDTKINHKLLQYRLDYQNPI